MIKFTDYKFAYPKNSLSFSMPTREIVVCGPTLAYAGTQLNE